MFENLTNRSSESVGAIIARELPLLRRYARSLTGNQSEGDRAVNAMLASILEEPSIFDRSLPPRIATFLAFQGIWRDQIMTPENRTADSRSRELMLLRDVEEFSLEDAARILGVDVEAARAVEPASKQFEKHVGSARVMIIEDEPAIAMDLRMIVEEVGLTVVGVADTRSSAVHLARRELPDLILADIQLADGSSGIDAVENIMATHPFPAVFITAYPERLLTGKTTEPTFLVTKPYRDEQIWAVISQALFHHGLPQAA